MRSVAIEVLDGPAFLVGTVDVVAAGQLSCGGVRSVTTAGDQDGDGVVDLAVGCDDDDPTLSIVSGASIRLGTPVVLATVTDTYEGTFVADHDGDGAPELVLAAPSGAGWRLRRSGTVVVACSPFSFDTSVAPSPGCR